MSNVLATPDNHDGCAKRKSGPIRLDHYVRSRPAMQISEQQLLRVSGVTESPSLPPRLVAYPGARVHTPPGSSTPLRGRVARLRHGPADPPGAATSRTYGEARGTLSTECRQP